MTRPGVKKLSYQNVLATVALVTSLGGTSYAAVTITSRNIQNGTIKAIDLDRDSVGSVQVIDRSLRLNDLSSSAKNALGGGRSLSEPAGQVVGRSSTSGFDPGSATILGSLTLPDGNYIARASAAFFGPLGAGGDTQPHEFFCRFGEVDGEATLARFDLDDGLSDRQTVPFEVALRAPTTPLQLACNTYNPSSSGNATADQLVMNAIRVVNL